MTDHLDSDWQTNGAGFHVNHKYGFGVLDAGALVRLATSSTWTSSKKRMMCKFFQKFIPNKVIPGNGHVGLVINSTGCLKPNKCVTKLEHVKVYVSLRHKHRGSLRITLTSPAGTRSELLAPRKRDTSQYGLRWWFMTVFSWGESPVGVWRLNVTDTSGGLGFIKRWSLRFYGTCDYIRNKKRDKKLLLIRPNLVKRREKTKELKDSN